MSFKKMHKKAYRLWMIASVLVAISMVAFLLAPLFLY